MDDDENEVQAGLQSELTDAARALIEDHGWTVDEVLNEIRATCK